MMHLVKKKRTVLTAVTLTALCLIFSSFLPTLHSQVTYVSSFTVPCTINTTGNAWGGTIAFDLEIGSGFMGVGANTNYLMVMDTNGTILALRESDSAYGAAWNIAPDTLMFLGEPQSGGANTAPLYASHFWNLSSGTTEDFPNVLSEHDIQYDPVNNTFLALHQYVQPVGSNLYLIDEIVELDTNGNVLWTWNPYNYLPLSEASPFNETSTYNGQTLIDFSHGNTLDWDYNDSIIYLNLRNTNTFYKINETSGDLIWACGEFGNFTLLDSNGQPLVDANGLPPSLWYHCHTMEEVAPDVFTLFNNDYENNTNPDDCHSSLMEITLNETSMTAYTDWSWEAPKQYWNPYGGAMVLLPNRDFIGDFGDPTHQNSDYPENQPWNFTDTGAVFVEVNPADQVVRTFTFPTGCYVYRIEPVTDPASIVYAAPVAIATPTPPPSNSIPIFAPTPSPLISPTPSPAPVTPTPSPVPTVTPVPSVTSFPSASPISAPSVPVSYPAFFRVTIAVLIVVAVAITILSYARKRSLTAATPWT